VPSINKQVIPKERQKQAPASQTRDAGACGCMGIEAYFAASLISGLFCRVLMRSCASSQVWQ